VEIIVIDGRDMPNPEDVAMLQALYSRSPKSVVVHLEDVKKRGSSSFVATYMVGYGHKSIGDCGTTTVCAENVSMLVAKAVQDTPLYNGQEASTRYLDMAAQEVLNPLGTPEGKAVQDGWMRLYSEALVELVPILKTAFPRNPDEKESVWEKAIKAKAFDIARCLLPAGCTTYVAWHVNLRQAADHLKEMRNHPLAEVREVAKAIMAALIERYPSSFSHKTYEAEEEYVRKSMERFAFYYEPITQFSYTYRLDHATLKAEGALLSSRPPKAELHQRFRQFGSITFRFPLDFGSYRDLQRQRSAVQEMPLLTTRLGFHPWYLENLPAGITSAIEDRRQSLECLDCDDLTKQYYTPMGFMVPVVLDCTLPSAVYIAELRSGQTVHPTLRPIAQRMGDILEVVVPRLAMHHDRAPDAWSVKRGTQDIVKKA
jgi:thymidylate synthase ThyX